MLVSCVYFTDQLTIKGAEIIILSAFRTHFLKEISRGQLQAAATTLKVKGVATLDKKNMLIPIANAMLKKGIVVTKRDVNLAKISKREDIKKVGTF